VIGYPGSHITTPAVANDKTKNTRKVEYHQVAEICWFGTHVATMVAELNDEAKSSKGGSLEKCAIPLLKYTWYQ
jgi:hypothetical protein